jgi:hypothetical protein
VTERHVEGLAWLGVPGAGCVPELSVPATIKTLGLKHKDADRVLCSPIECGIVTE